MGRVFLRQTLCLIMIGLGFSLSLVGCTDGSSGLVPSVVDGINGITDGVKDIINPDKSISEPETTAPGPAGAGPSESIIPVNIIKKQISEIQNDLNKNSTYALTEEDVVFLKTEGVLDEENSIKEWVK